MLEQRRAQKEGYITLREAAEITNYAPDYIGQLIRNGKIRGEQVYSNVAWVTTEDELRAYMADKSRSVTNSEVDTKLEIVGGRLASYLLYTVIGLLFCAILVMQYIFYVSVDDSVTKRIISSEITENTS